MARPRKPDARHKMLKIRLSTAEYEAIRCRAGSRPVSEWARQTLLACEPVTESELMPLNELMQRSREERQLAREIRAARGATIFELALATEAQVRQARRLRRDAGQGRSPRGEGLVLRGSRRF